MKDAGVSREERSGIVSLGMLSSHQVDARGGAQGGGDGRQDGNDEMQYFLDEFFFVHV